MLQRRADRVQMKLAEVRDVRIERMVDAIRLLDDVERAQPADPPVHRAT